MNQVYQCSNYHLSCFPEDVGPVLAGSPETAIFEATLPPHKGKHTPALPQQVLTAQIEPEPH